jgi:hypothetical protein
MRFFTDEVKKVSFRATTGNQSTYDNCMSNHSFCFGMYYYKNSFLVTAGNPSLVPAIESDTLYVIKNHIFLVSTAVDRPQRCFLWYRFLRWTVTENQFLKIKKVEPPPSPLVLSWPLVIARSTGGW